MCGQSEEILHACCKSSRVKLVKIKDVPSGNVTILAINAKSTNTLVQYWGGLHRGKGTFPQLNNHLHLILD